MMTACGLDKLALPGRRNRAVKGGLLFACKTGWQGLTKKVNRPDRWPEGERRRGFRAVRHGSRQCRLGPS